MLAAGRALARVQHGQPERALIAHERSERLAAHRFPAAVRAGQQQEAVAGVLVKRAVAEKVQDVVLLLEQLLLQRGDGRRFETVDRHNLALL